MTETAGIDSVRARSFGAAAADYDKYRPRYPDQMVDDVVATLSGRRALEVGAGTGIATAAFAARGMAMTCIEPDAEMAAMLSAKFAADADLHVNVATFEEWAAARPAGVSGFDGLISAQAWHWTDPKTLGRRRRRGPKQRHDRAVLERGPPRRSAGLGRVYGRVRPPWHRDSFGSHGDGTLIRPDKIVDQRHLDGWPEGHAEADEYFTNLRTYQYHWTDRMSVGDYVARINTTSAHLILSPEARDDMPQRFTILL